MSFVYEMIPKEEYWRFEELSEFRKNVILDSKEMWAIDKNNDLFVIKFSGRERPHKPDNLGERTPMYYLLCSKGYFFSYEGIESYVSVDTGNKELWKTVYTEGVLYLSELLKNKESDFKNILYISLKNYFTELGHYSHKKCTGGVDTKEYDVELSINEIIYLSKEELTRHHLNLW